jgi:zinc protease
MKKLSLILSSLFLITILPAQDRPQPKAGPAPSINISQPQSFSLPNGLQVLVLENHKLPRVSFELTLDNLPFAEGAKKGVDDLTSALIGKGSKSISKDAFNEEIDFLGAKIEFHSSGATAKCLSKNAHRILELMADGALNPNFTLLEFDKEKEKLLEDLKAEEKNVQAVASRVQNVVAFGPKHPNGEFLSQESINNVFFKDVVAYYNQHFNPNNAYLVIVGDVTYNDIKTQVEKLFSPWQKTETIANIAYPEPENAAFTQINFIDMPNAVQSRLVFQNTVKLKMNDKDYFAALLANQIFGGDFNGYLNMNLREKHGFTYGAHSSIQGDKYVTAFRATSQVRNAVTADAVAQALKEIKRIRTEKVSDEVLANVPKVYQTIFIKITSRISMPLRQMMCWPLPINIFWQRICKS